MNYNDNLHSFKSISDARSWYNELLKFDYKSNKTKRKYLKGSFYKTMFKFKNINILNWKVIGNFDIKVDITPGNHTFIKVRKCDSNISTAILMLHKKLFQLKGNSRGNKSGDLGVMHSLGKKINMKNMLHQKITLTYKC